MTRVLFVCLGNICRSPTAQGIFQKMIDEADLGGRLRVDSCGTGSWHVGQPPDERTLLAAGKQGYDLSDYRARKLEMKDFDRYDYILAMDTRNLADIIKHAPDRYPGRIQLLMDYSEEKNILEVPDPYYGGEQGFARVVSLLEGACKGLFDKLAMVHACDTTA